MEPLSLTILIVIGIIGWLVNALALVMDAPFSPLVFPIIPASAVPPQSWGRDWSP